MELSWNLQPWRRGCRTSSKPLMQGKSEAGREFRISQPAVRYNVPAGQAASPFTPGSYQAPGRAQDDSEPLRPTSSLQVRGPPIVAGNF